MRPALLFVLLAALAAASPARAAAPVLTFAATPREGAILGQATRVTGVLRQDGAPLAGRMVTLEGRAHPFDGPWVALASQVTRADGGYAFERRLQRNHDLRVVAAAPLTGRSRTARVHVFPRARLDARTVRRGVVRLTQTLTVPSNVRLTAPTRFYLGRAGADAAPYRVSARPRRVRAGTYRARVSVRVPAAYRGRFSYAACFRATPGSGLGDPEATCPRRAFAF
jgi:hypothetical protein